MNFQFLQNPVVTACLAAITATSLPVLAQQAPADSGRTQDTQRQIPTLPQPGAPNVETQSVRRAFTGGDLKVTPSGFRFSGNTSIPEAELQAVIANFVGKEANFNDLADAAALLRKHYEDKGFVLTDVYFPEQEFNVSGGVVEFAVIEARVGSVVVKVAEGSGVSQAFASALTQSYLPTGAPITQYLLDRPVLLLRDMAATEAEAVVVPGTKPGEADIEITVTRRGAKYEAYVSADNMGGYSSGEYRFAVGGSLIAPLGMGDLLSARVQTSDKSGNTLYRLSYGLRAGSLGTSVNASYTESAYSLGPPFEALGSSGKAKVAALSAIHPMVRGRFTNVFALVAFDDKTFNDDITQFGNFSGKHVKMGRVGLLGNHSDPILGGGTTSFSATVSAGNLTLDDKTAVQDIGVAPNFGPRTAGNFQKLNLELQRVQFLSDRSSVLMSLLGQLVSKNLTSGEKFSLGGPQGVRGYPVGEGVGDEGVLATVEYRYQTGLQIFEEALTLTTFYDYGRIRRDKIRDSQTLNSVQSANSLSLDSFGVGMLLGREGNFVFTGALAGRIGGPLPTSGAPDSRVRGWLLLQKWF